METTMSNETIERTVIQRKPKRKDCSNPDCDGKRLKKTEHLCIKCGWIIYAS